MHWHAIACPVRRGPFLAGKPLGGGGPFSGEASGSNDLVFLLKQNKKNKCLWNMTFPWIAHWRLTHIHWWPPQHHISFLPAHSWECKLRLLETTAATWLWNPKFNHAEIFMLITAETTYVNQKKLCIIKSVAAWQIQILELERWVPTLRPVPVQMSERCRLPHASTCLFQANSASYNLNLPDSSKKNHLHKRMPALRIASPSRCGMPDFTLRRSFASNHPWCAGAPRYKTRLLLRPDLGPTLLSVSLWLWRSMETRRQA